MRQFTNEEKCIVIRETIENLEVMLRSRLVLSICIAMTDGIRTVIFNDEELKEHYKHYWIYEIIELMFPDENKEWKNMALDRGSLYSWPAGSYKPRIDYLNKMLNQYSKKS